MDSNCYFLSYRPGDTILIAAGGSHHVANIQIRKPLCLVSYPICVRVCETI